MSDTRQVISATDLSGEHVGRNVGIKSMLGSEYGRIAKIVRRNAQTTVYFEGVSGEEAHREILNSDRIELF